ncbi:MAG TPA: hypothetical protein GXX28_03830 [Firmicutes bacterium]|nr:hypothetical protein [Bacillota bacterium]
MLARVPRAARVIVLAACVAFLVLVGMAAAAVTSPEWRVVHTAFRVTYTSPASYTQVVERRFGDRSRRDEFRVWQDGGRRKVVQIAPSSRAGLTLWRDHLSEVAYAPGFQYVLKSGMPRPPHPPGPVPWRLFLRRPHLTLGDAVLPGGIRTRTVVIAAGRAVRLKLWVEPTTNFILRQERYSPEGELFDVTENRDVSFDPAGLAAALRVETPAGARVLTSAPRWRSEFALFVLRREAPFPFLVPKKLPRGYHLVYAEALRLSGRQVVALRFARGRSGFSLFEYPAGGTAEDVAPEKISRTFAADEAGDGRVFRTVRSGMEVVAVGRLSPSDAEALFSAWERVLPRSEKGSPASSEM